MTEISAITGLPKSKKGFAGMSLERRRAIAAKGGKGVAKENRSFSRNPGLASSAGKIGGHGLAPEQRSFSQDRALAAEAGRRGGQTRAAKAAAALSEKAP